MCLRTRTISFVCRVGFIAILASMSATALTVTGVQSRKTHAGVAGYADRELDRNVAINGALTVEPRAIDSGHAIVFQFDETIASAGSASVIDAFGTTAGSATTQASGSTVIVTLSNVADARRVTILLSGVNDSFNTQVSVGFLLGDTNNSYNVSAADISAVKARSGQVVSIAANNYGFDLNGSGVINAADIAAVKSRNGRSLVATSITYTVGGTLTGLDAGKTLVLRNNGANNLSLNVNGTFTFAASLAGGATYSVSVQTHPAGQVCTMANANGTIGSANVTDVNVSCAISPPDTTVPVVSIIAPALNATVSGSTVTVSATATDNVGVVGVQFKLDGINLQTEDTTSPYSISWDTTTTTEGTHTLTAIARDAAGNSTNTTDITVTVSNPAGPPQWIGEFETAWDNTTSPKATASLNVQTGDVLVAYAMSEADIVAIDISGGALTWTQRQAVVESAFGWVGIWTATATANASMTVTFASSGGTGKFGGNVVQFRNAAIGASASTFSASGAPTLALTTTAANSAIVVANVDWSAKAGAHTWRTNAGAFTELTYQLDVCCYAVYGGYHPNAVTIGTYAVGLSAPSTQKYAIAAIEIKGARPPITYTVGGTLSGLGVGKAVVLRNNAGNDLSLNANGTFTFSVTLVSGATYGVTVLIHPAGQTCTVGNGSGTIGSTNVSNVNITCATATPTVTITGATRAVASKRYSYDATVADGVATAVSWAWGDGSSNAAGTPAMKVWNKPGVFAAISSATVAGSVYVATKSTTVVGEPISAGNSHTCALRPDGSVSCWGRNNWGQLGDDSGVNQPTPVTVTGLSSVVALSAGADHTCALKSDTSVACWGRNESGQLGDGSTVNKPTPVSIAGLSNVVALNSTHSHTCAVKSDGSAVCWGDNFYGQLGDGSEVARPSPVAVSGLTGVAALAAGGHHTCALKTDGSVSCWGERSYGQMGDGNTNSNQLTPSVVPGLSGVVALAAGYAANFAVKSDGSVSFWGTLNSHLGNGTGIFDSPPTTIAGLSGVVTMGVGADHICVLKDDASLACWGYNFYGQLGNGNTSFTTIPGSPLITSTDLSDVVALSGGNTHTCVLKADGTAVCWGANSVGELGNGGALEYIYNPWPVVGGAIFWK